MSDPERPEHGDLHDRDLQELAAYAAEVLGAPVALVTELGEDRQTFLANVGFGRDWTTLEESFCAHAALHQGVFEVSDAAADPRFADNPLVTGDPHVRFYAGVAVPSGDGAPVNALCVLDTRPRELTAFQRRTLEMLGRQVEARLELRNKTRELERSTAEAHRSAELVRMVTDRLPVRVAYVDRGFRFRFANDAYLAQAGVSREALLGVSVAEALGETLFERVRPNLERSFAGETHVEEFDAPYETGPRPIRVTYVPDRGPAGNVLGAVVQALDLSEQRASDKARHAAEARYRTLFDSIDQGFAVVEVFFDEGGRPLDYRFREFNKAFEEQGGIPAEQARAGMTIRQIAPDIEESWIQTYGRIANSGVAESFVMGAAALDRHYEMYAFPIGETGREVGIIFRDVRERLAAERALSEARERLDRTLDVAGVATYELDVHRDRVWGNGLFAEFFGVPSVPEGAPIATCLDGVHPDDRPRVEAAIGHSLRTGEFYEAEYRVRGEHGRDRTVLARGDATLDEGGRPWRLTGVILDITERATAEEAVRHREELFRTVFEQAPDDAIVAMDLDRTITAWNPAAERIMAWTGEEAIGRSSDMIFTPEDREGCAPEGETSVAARDGKAVDERWHLRKDGTRFWGSGTMNALHDADGTVRGFLKVFRDATEKRELQKRLETAVAERTEELERAVSEAEGFNYAISHDLRTPLRAIAMTSSILMEEAGSELSFGHRELLDRQGRAASRLAQLIDGLLQLSRLSRVDLKRTRIDMTQEARESTRDSGCAVEVQEGMAAVGDPGLVRSVWQNLIGNACKFSPNGGTVRVGHDGAAFFVRDEGVGFDLRYAPKIFLPFERLVADDEFPGTGIGLANVKRIVERHGGQVWAESEPGKGSTFRFTLAPERTS